MPVAPPATPDYSTAASTVGAADAAAGTLPASPARVAAAAARVAPTVAWAAGGGAERQPASAPPPPSSPPPPPRAASSTTSSSSSSCRDYTPDADGVIDTDARTVPLRAAGAGAASATSRVAVSGRPPTNGREVVGVLATAADGVLASIEAGICRAARRLREAGVFLSTSSADGGWELLRSLRLRRREWLADFSSYRFADTWGGTDAAASAVVEGWFATGALSRLPPLAGAPAGVAALRDRGARLVVVTSRQAAVAAETGAWLAATYPGAFEGLGCGNAWGRDGGRRVSKRELCAAAGACLLVDDNPAYCAEVECEAVCFDLGGGYGWSKGGGWGGARAESWEEVVAVADKLVWGQGGGGG
ncbi:hypothetical protein I4F81_006838 [Pyropia yezoensis]|uniref:Uncharacterized protein n=1 Tax=Pyropia yezoensis TaxID=2788 RepID=A0ACC3C1T7_PYRYE|nr:hypothetical protein I4F81_006838 [Neopyropia yezoensis]